MSADSLFKAALKIRQNSYSPYSKYQVASSILTSDGQIFSGINVENASYGATMCAERSAIFTAVTQGHKKIQEVLVLTDESEPWPPCGLCRQVIAEFASNETLIHLANLKGVKKTLKFSELFPQAFTSAHLK